VNKELQEINKELESFDNDLSKKKQYIILNKIDLISKENVNLIKKEIYKTHNKEDIFFTSTVNNEGVKELKNYISKKLNELKKN